MNEEVDTSIIFEQTPCPVDISPLDKIRETRLRTNANLIPPVKGERRNPYGRPIKNNTLTTLIKEKLEDRHKDGRTYAQHMADAVVELAISKGARGQIPAIKEVLDRTEGKVTETIEVDKREVRITYQLVGDDGF